MRIESSTFSYKKHSVIPVCPSEIDWFRHLLISLGSLRLELNAIPAIVLEHALRRQRDLHWLYEKRRLLAIVRSVFNIVTVFLASPALVTPNLPMFSYTSIWYGLLVLSKLSFLSDAATKGKAVEVYNKDTHNVGLAAMQKMEAMSRRNDVWNNCCTVIGSISHG